MKPREKCIDPDYRRDPNTELFCCRCQRSGAVRYLRVYLRASGHVAVHPNDVEKSKRPDDLGWQPIGLDCARIIGKEWCAL